MGRVAEHPRQVPCHITYTSARTHEYDTQRPVRSPLFNGAIEGVGPRYCPSIEDKVVRFADKDSAPDLRRTGRADQHEIYPNGISTSLPFDVQLDFMRSIKGFERAHITRPAMPSSTTISIRETSRRGSKQRRLPACSSPVRSTAPPATRRPPRRACWPASMPRAVRAGKNPGIRVATRLISA
jgi:hypothetical protein